MIYCTRVAKIFFMAKALTFFCFPRPSAGKTNLRTIYFAFAVEKFFAKKFFGNATFLMKKFFGAVKIMAVAAVDPGKDKCGIAVLDENGGVFLRRVVATKDMTAELAAAAKKFGARCIVLGDGTTSQKAKLAIKNALPDLPVETVDEYRTTELARKEYFAANPPKGWRKFLPLTMQTPPVPVDDFAAVILGKRYLENKQ